MSDGKPSPAEQGIVFSVPTAILKLGRVIVATLAAFDACGHMGPTASGRDLKATYTSSLERKMSTEPTMDPFQPHRGLKREMGVQASMRHRPRMKRCA